MRRPYRRPSLRDTLAVNQKALDDMALMYGKPKLEPVIVLPPKRKYTKRTDVASEHQEQAAVIKWWSAAQRKYNLPEFALFAIPNGGARDPITGARLKAEGVRHGTPDLLLARPIRQHAGLFIELKRDGGRVSDAQKEFVAYLQSVGYVAAVAWGADEAIKLIEAYLLP